MKLLKMIAIIAIIELLVYVALLFIGVKLVG